MDEGLNWCVEGAAAGLRPALFGALVSVMSAGDRAAALRREGLTVKVKDYENGEIHIDAEHPAGFYICGNPSCLTADLCYWEDFTPEDASSAEEYTRHREAFDRAYLAVRALGCVELGEPAMEGCDPDEYEHRWSVWRAGEVILAVYQAVSEVGYQELAGIQLDARRYPATATLEPTLPFAEWMRYGAEEQKEPESHSDG